MNNTAYPIQYLQGIEYFNHGAYFEAHEIWEEIWMESTKTQKIFYQALIQLAVALHHLESQNLKGALSLYPKTMEKLSQLPDLFTGLNIRELEKNIDNCFQNYITFKPGDNYQIQYDNIPKITLITTLT